MSEVADRVSEALLLFWECVAARACGAWLRRERGMFGAFTGAPAAALNGVWVIDRCASASAIDALLGEFAAAGLPHCLQARPGCEENAVVIAARRGMVQAENLPLMHTVKIVQVPPIDRFAIRLLAPQELGLHVETVAAGFEVGAAVFQPILTERLLGADGLCAYVGEIDGDAVTTAMALTRARGVGIFNVATPPPYRGRGYGAAITAKAALDGFTNGADYAWLQSSLVALSVYESLVFTTLESWRCWVTPGEWTRA